MAFQFLIKKSGRLPAANVWLLDGELLSGEVRNNTSAIVQIETGPIPVTIKTVGFVSIKDFNKRELTLNIDQPVCDIQMLEGKMLVAEEETSKP